MDSISCTSSISRTTETTEEITISAVEETTQQVLSSDIPRASDLYTRSKCVNKKFSSFRRIRNFFLQKKSASLSKSDESIGHSFIPAESTKKTKTNYFRRKFAFLTKKQIPDLTQESQSYKHPQLELSFRELAKGSPKNPHRIIQISSLNDDKDKQTSSTFQLILQQQSALKRKPANIKKRSCLSQQRWNSMGDISTTLPGSKRGSGEFEISYLSSSINFKPRPGSLNPTCVVSSTGNFRIPFNELDQPSTSSSHMKSQRY